MPSYGHYLFFFVFAMLIDKGNEFIGDALYPGFAVFGYIFAEAIFLEFFHLLNAFAADAADGYFSMLSFAEYAFYKFFATFFGEWREEQANEIAIVLRVEADVGRYYSAFDGL